MLLRYGSEIAVSAYGIIGYVFSIFYMLFEGIALGVQPIIGFNYGAGYYKRVSQTLKMTMISCILIGALGFVLIYTFPERVVRIFSQDESELLKVTLQGMKICMLSLFVEGTVLLTVIYYQSINRVREALIIYLGKIFIFLLPLLFILPVFFGLAGVWFASPATEYVMAVITLVMKIDLAFSKSWLEIKASSLSLTAKPISSAKGVQKPGVPTKVIFSASSTRPLKLFRMPPTPCEVFITSTKYSP